MSGYGGNSNLAAKVSKIYAGVDDVARKVNKAYVGDANGLAQLIFSAETPLTISYTGTYTDEVVTMTDGTYRLLTLTGSGTLTFNQNVECDVWLCGGGGGGASAYWGKAGAGGFCNNAFSQVVQNLIVEIGAGSAGMATGKDTTGVPADGSATSISGDITLTANGATWSATSMAAAVVSIGGSGGGAGARSSASVKAVGTGQGSTTKPFADVSLSPYCAGGGGGAWNSNDNDRSCRGGNGGSDGSDGGVGTYDTSSSGYGTGGSEGGGSGGSAGTQTTSRNTGASATAWGSGGGGGGYGETGGGAEYFGGGGAGYQGCVMLRIKLNDQGLNLIAFTIDSVSYSAEDGMTWAEWVASGYNTAGFYVHANGWITNTGSTGIVADDGINYLQSTAIIVADKAYTLG